MFSGAQFLSITSRGAERGNIVTHENYGDIITEHSTIFKRGKIVTSAFMTIESHSKMKDFLHFDETVFAANLNSKMIIGIGKDIFKHDIREKSWKSVQNYKNAYCERTHAVACEIHGAVLVCGGTNKPYGLELIAWNRPNSCRSDESHISNKLHKTHEELKECLTPVLGPQTYCTTRLPISLFFGHTVTRIGKRTVLVVGGANELEADNGWGNAWDGSDELKGTESNRAFRGTLNDSQDDLIWEEVDRMKHIRLNHIAFKMKQSVYVIGGSSSQECERYDLKEQKWFESYHIPPTFCCTPYSAIVDDHESIAILLCDHYFPPISSDGKEYMKLNIKRQKVNIFSEEKGFQTLTVDFITDKNIFLSKSRRSFFRHFATTKCTS